MLGGLQREKDEELGKEFKVSVCPTISYNVYFIKKSGQHMIVPHFVAKYMSGQVVLSEEYMIISGLV